MNRPVRPLEERGIRAALTLATLAGALLVLSPAVRSRNASYELRVAAREYSAHRFDAALSAAVRALERSPDSPAALLLAGYAAADAADFEQSDALLRRIPEDCPQIVPARLRLARNLLQHGRVVDAERHLRFVLEQDPDNAEAHRLLGYLLQAEGRVWESASHLGTLLVRGDFDFNELFMLSSLERYFRIDPKLRGTLEAERPGDLLIRLGDIRRNLIEGRDAGMRVALEELVARYPQLAEPRARLGRLIVDAGDRGGFLQWNSSVSRAHEHHPEIWFVRGLQARRENRLPEAVRCFAECLLRAPHHSGANHQIGAALLQLGHSDQAQEFSALPPVLFRLDQQLHLLQETPTADNARQVVRLLQQLGRHWEAAGWAHLARQLPGSQSWQQAVIRTEAPLLSVGDGLIDRRAQPALRLELQAFPVPDWPHEAGDRTVPLADDRHLTEAVSDDAPDDRHCHWRFADCARTAGIDFQYFDGTTFRDRMRHIVETLGGGGGVVDFDADGWPDLYLAQGHAWRRPDTVSRPLDRLFRNLGSGRFADVTAHCGIAEDGMSHGVAVGDYDGDGWPDLYVTNLGGNSLFRNNGDGTFSDQSAHARVQGDEWSATAAIADLSGDGLPEIFVVNYLDREFVIANPCERNGQEVGCTPDLLPPARNRLYQNSGDGRFTDVSDSSGVRQAAGNGLGLIIADFFNEGRLSVFVGNDSTPNFLFRNATLPEHAELRFHEQGMLAGVALNGNGIPMASMGIAAGDANGDGLLDLFVTTYMNDPDTLFIQQAGGGLFIDETRRYRLQFSTSSMLGFGSQFIDVDNDGWEDVAATNGHVIPPPPDGPDDERDLMRTQLLANHRDGSFVELPAESPGPFFQFRGLGRGLAELDWDRDGRQDFWVSHIHSPVSLLRNETDTGNRRLVVRLIGTISSRDASGAVVTAHIGTRQLMRQLVAGGGYLSANERHLWFGLGRASQIDELVVRWPSGAMQKFVDVQADRDIAIVENRDTPFVIGRFATP